MRSAGDDESAETKYDRRRTFNGSSDSGGLEDFEHDGAKNLGFAEDEIDGPAFVVRAW